MKKRHARLLDLLLLRYPGETRENHLASVLCGEVLVAGERVRDPKREVPTDAAIDFASKAFVSRGGDKLEAALEAWRAEVRGRVVLDAGSSTGGFTDCLLKRGAAVVHAVDSGRNQMRPVLRGDSRVRLLERTNIMAVESLDPVPDFGVCDLSFRSLRGAARHILDLTSGRRLFALVKPQFEWRNPPDNFDGVVRSDEAVADILTSLVDSFVDENISVIDVMESPIRGRSGNREFFFHLTSGSGAGGAEARESLRRLALRIP